MLTPEIQAQLEALAVYPRTDELSTVLADPRWQLTGNVKTLDGQAVKREDLAPMMIERLRFLYPEILEAKYAELPAANGDIFPIDDSVPAGAVEWKSETMEVLGFAQWVDDDGKIAPTGATVFGQAEGRLKEMAHAWEMNEFDLERAAYAKVPIESTRGRASKRVIDAKCQWTWLFGDFDLGLYGCFSHPNITRVLAPQSASGGNSRLWSGKTNAEIAADVALVIDTVRAATNRQEQAAIVYVPENLYKLAKRKLLGESSGLLTSLWDWIVDQHKGDESGTGKVTFKILNECEAAYRRNPETNTDTSGISGDFLFARPAEDKRMDAFMRSRRFTQRPPQQIDFAVKHLCHAKVGGFRTERPLAFAMLVFVA
jgi:hypothetical protein